MLTVAIGSFVAESAAGLTASFGGPSNGGPSIVAIETQPPNAIALAQRPGTT